MAGRGHGGHGHGPMSTERAKDFKGTMKKLMAYPVSYTHLMKSQFKFVKLEN